MAGPRNTDKPFTVALFSALPEFGNQGCNALTVSFMKLVLDEQPNARFVFLHRLRAPLTKAITINGRSVAMELVNCRLAPRALFKDHLFLIYLLALAYRLVPARALRDRILRMSPWIRTLAEADIIADHFYGDSFSDIYGLRRLLSYASLRGTALVMARPILLLPQTYGPFRSHAARRIARSILSRASHILARDPEGLEAVRQVLGNRVRPEALRFCPDLAMALDPQRPETADIRPPLPDTGGQPLVGLNVSGLLYNGGYSRDNMFSLECDYAEMARQLVRRLLEETDAHILLVPHVFSDDVESDNLACAAIADAVQESQAARVHLVARRYDQNEIKGIIGQCQFFIGSRMHACIAALSQGIPAVGIAYSNKFRGVFASVGLQDAVIDARKQGTDEAVQSCLRHFATRATLAATLREHVPRAQAALRACLNELIQAAASTSHVKGR